MINDCFRPCLRRGSLLVLVIAPVAAPIFGQTPPDTGRTYVLDPVTVTATQIEALRSRVPNAVSLITRSDIERSGETSILPLISRRVPGAFVTERGVLGHGVAQGASGMIMIRGTGGNPNTGVLVLTDGRPQMMGLMGHPLPDTYVSSGVERVEIIRGPASLLHGTNAMGGVVNIIYERPAGPGYGLNAGASYGTFNTQKYELGGMLGFQGGGITISGNHHQTNGHRPSSSFNSSSAAVRGNFLLGERYGIAADVSVTGFRTYDPGPASAPRVDNWADIARGSSGISIETRNGNAGGALKAFLNWGRHDLYDGFHSTDKNLGLLLYHGFRLFPDNITTIGVDLKRYGGIAENGVTGFDYGQHFVNEYGVYVLFQQRILDALTATGGIRLNRHSMFAWESVPQIGLTYQAAPATTLKASASKGFRSPTIRELYLFPAPTRTLQPERQWTYEVGALQGFGESTSIEFSAFISEGSNIILTRGVYPNLSLSNSGTFTHRGIEVTGRFAPFRDLAIDVSYSFLDPGVQTNASPQHKACIGATFTTSAIDFSADVQYVGGLYGDDFGRKHLPDYILLNSRVTGMIGAGILAYLAIENLLGRGYQILFDYPMPGTTVFLGLRWTMR
jgi:iron complex outermembrane receptor protein